MPRPTASVAPCPVPLIRFADITHPERAVARGDLIRVRVGVYAPAPEWRALAPWDRYLARVHAVARVRPDAVFCLESAAALTEVPVFGDPVVVHVLVPPHVTARLVSGVRSHTFLGDRDIISRGGLLMTNLADTAVDLARFRHAAIGLSAADAAVRLTPGLTAGLLLERNEARVSKRGRGLARWPLGFADALAATALESVSRGVIHWLGFPAPRLQQTFRSRSGEADRPDFFWPESDLAGDADGDIKYDGRYGHPTAILRRQGERDARLRHHVRFVAHWGWREATTVSPLRSTLLGAGLRQRAPEDTVHLFSLRRAVSPFPPHAPAATPRDAETPSDG